MEIEKDLQRPNFFVKEQGYTSAAVPFAYGLYNKDKKTRSDKEEKEVKLYTDYAKILYDKYKYLQDRFDEAVASNEMNEDVFSGLVEYVSILSGILPMTEQGYRDVYLSNDIMQMMLKGANNHNHSVCSSMLMLEGEMRGYTVNEKNDTVKQDNKFLVKKWHERVKNYQFNTKEPVDKNADMFLSYLSTMLLAMHGFKVDKGFVDFLVDDLKGKGIDIPQDLKDLNKGKIAKFVDSEGNIQDYEKKKDLIRNYSFYGIDDAYDYYLVDKTAHSLNFLNKTIADFVLTQIQDVADFDFFEIDENLKEIMKFTYELEKGIANGKKVASIKEDFEKMTSTEKTLDKGAIKLAMYAPIYNIEQRALKQVVKEKKIEQPIAIEEKPTMEVQKPVTKVEKVETIEETNSKVEVVKEETPVSKTEVKEKAEAKNEVEDLRRKKEQEKKLPLNGMDMFEFASQLFLQEKDYDLQKLSNIEMTISKSIGDEKIEYKEKLFGNLVESKKIKVIDGERKKVLKSLEETYDDVRTTFMDLDVNLQKGLLKHMHYVDKAEKQAKAMIKNYSKLTEDQKQIVKKLAVKDAEIREELYAKIDNLQKEREEAMLRKKRDAKIAEKLMEEYNFKKPEKTNKKEVENSIMDFFNTIK